MAKKSPNPWLRPVRDQDELKSLILSRGNLSAVGEKMVAAAK